jgi:type 1 glutamine amidotransferase
MKVLVLCDDYWHPARTPREGLQALTGSEFAFDWIEDARDWSPEIMRAYPLVILTKSNNISAGDQTGWMTDNVQAVFVEFVRRGGGSLAIHSGTAEYEEKRVLRSLLGGVFAHHPEQCPVTIQPRAGHPLTAGSASFTVQDEHYFMALDDTQADVFVTTTSQYGEQPGGWRRVEGSGRVVVLTPGHNIQVWLHPSFRALLLNALRWCGNPSAALESH